MKEVKADGAFYDGSVYEGPLSWHIYNHHTTKYQTQNLSLTLHIKLHAQRIKDNQSNLLANIPTPTLNLPGHNIWMI
jgi:hypothetical protein